jgi:hypothetical protein
VLGERLLMAFLRRLLGGGQAGTTDAQARDEEPGTGDTAALDTLERDYELEVLREEQGRLDELQERQLRYARYAWQPPSQGGERRADDADEGGR